MHSKSSIDPKRPLSHPMWARDYLTHRAAKRGNTGILTLVLSYGGNAVETDGFDNSTLHDLSLSSNKGDCVEVLVSRGALSILDYKAPRAAMTLFALAIASCNFAVADRLIEYI